MKTSAPPAQPQKRSRQRPFRLTAVWAAVLAVFLQAFVVQAHVHALVSAPAAAFEQSTGAAHGETHVSAAHDALCALCEVLAASGRALTPAPTALTPQPRTQAEPVAIALRQAPRAITHGWRSRAPPIAS